MQQYVGIDLHRRRSVIVRMTPGGEVIKQGRIDNDPVALSLEMAKAGPEPEVVLLNQPRPRRCICMAATLPGSALISSKRR